MGSTMKAVIQTGYGSADVMKLRELEKPVAGDGEVLVRVRAASLAAGEYFGMRGTPFPIRFYIGFPKPKKDFVVGIDLRGRRRGGRPERDRFQPGDEVYGECRGSCAEYAVAKEGSLAPKPANLSFEQAAAVPTSACTALQALRDHGKVQPGQKVLINGASGGVGPFAVQIAKALGAEVTGVCSTGNVEMVRSIGADHVIDYTKEDFTQGERALRRDPGQRREPLAVGHRRVLTPGGPHARAAVTPAWAGSSRRSCCRSSCASRRARSSRPRTRTTCSRSRSSSRPARSRRSSTGRIRSSETAEAFAYLDEGHARGKVVIVVTNGE